MQKNQVLTLLLAALASVSAYSQVPVHSNSFACTPSSSSTSTSPGTTNMYIIAGVCGATVTDTTGFALLQSNLPPNCTSTDSPRSPGDVKSYVFTAVIGGTESKPSNCFTATTPLFAPTQLSVKQGTGNQALLTWTASADLGTTVTVKRATGSCTSSLTYSTLSTTAPAGGPFTDSTVSAGSTYCFQLFATAGSVTSNGSAPFSVSIVQAASSAPPSSLTVTVK